MKTGKRNRKWIPMAAVLVAVGMLGACGPQKISPAAKPETENRETKQEESSVQADRAEEPEVSAEEDSREGENPAEEEQPKLQIPESLSGESEEQTAVYTLSYSDSGLYLVDCIRLYAREDKVCRLEEQIELCLREEELGLDVGQGDLEEMLDAMGELFQGLLDDYGKNEGITTELRRQEKQYLMDITCEVTEETAQGIVDAGFLDVEDTSELLSFQKMCEMLEEENYTRAN